MKISLPPKISLYSAVIVASILILAALAKGLFPSPFPQPFHLGTVAVVIELAAAILVLSFHRSAAVWQMLSLLFSFWLGYSFFWLIQNQSCGCFGALGTASSGLALGLDLFMIALSWMNMVNFGVATKKILTTIVCAVLVAVMGFWLGTYAFYTVRQPPEAPTEILPNPKLPVPAIPPGSA